MRQTLITAWDKKIIHIDMDAFFAAIEQRDHPELRGEPVVVGGDPYGRGVVSTASYEARRFGIHSAMPAAQARRLCPSAIFLMPHFDRYRQASHIIMSLLRQHTPLVEPASMDEAYLDVTYHRFGMGDPALIASIIKQNIFAVTKLTASAGVAPNLFLAKVASDFNKPDGLTVIFPGTERDFLEKLPVRKIPGVGPKTEAQLTAHHILTCGDLAAADVSFLCRTFGKLGIFLHQRACGIDRREVETEGESKQFSTEETFRRDLLDLKKLKDRLKDYAETVFWGLRKEHRMGRTVVLKVKYFDFKLITRSHTLEHDPESETDIYLTACELLEKKTKAGRTPIRLLGLGISGLKNPADHVPENQLNLPAFTEDPGHRRGVSFV